jgi:hypothetical protein
MHNTMPCITVGHINKARIAPFDFDCQILFFFNLMQYYTIAHMSLENMHVNNSATWTDSLRMPGGGFVYSSSRHPLKE